MNRLAFASLLAAAAVAGSAFAAGANAATVTTPVISTGWFSADAPGALVSLPLFDSNLGTLTQVSVSETGFFRGSAILHNEAPSPESFTFHLAGQVGVDLSSSDPGAVALDLKGFVFNPVLPTAAYSLGKVGSPTASDSYGVYTTAWGSGAITNLATPDFQAAGGGNAAVHIDAFSFYEDNPNKIEFNDVFFQSGPIEAQANFQITYSYVPGRPAEVPEPATWALMLLGFGGAGAALRRRNAPLSRA